MPAKRISKYIRDYLNFALIKEHEKFFITVFLMVIYLVIWAGFIDFMRLPFSMKTIVKIHTTWLVWLVDFLVACVSLGAVIFINHDRNIKNKQKKELAKLKSQLESNHQVAELIRKGEYNKIMHITDHHSSLLDLAKNLMETNQKEEAVKWITKGKDIINEVLRKYRKIDELSIEIIKAIIQYTDAIQGAFYLLENDKLVSRATYAFNRQRFVKQEFEVGRGLVGQVAYEKAMIYRTEIPDDYFTVTSGLLNDVKPKSLLILPLMQEDELQGVVEVAFLQDHIPSYKLDFAEELSSMIGRTIYAQKINARTEVLLKESQEMTVTLQRNEEKLKENAREMMIAQEELEQSNELLESKIQEVENGQKRMVALLTNASEFISIYNEDQQLVFESPSVKRILGYADDENIVGMDPELMTPKGYKTINKLFEYLKQTPGGESVAQYAYLKKSGEKLFLETKGKNLLHDPAIKGIIFNTQDITERIRAEKEERMKSRMQSLSENSPDMIIRINTTGKLVYANPVVSEFMGLSIQEITKKRINDLHIDERFIEFINNVLKEIKNNEEQIIDELEIAAPEGSKIMQIKAIPEHSEDNVLESILFVAHDMTEIKMIEQEIKEKNKKISDSINYAQRIQTSILPDTSFIQRHFPRSFIFYRPKDVVSGDFPWFVKKDETFYVAAVDCTGHGVPGALLSFIGYFLLNNIVNIDDNFNAAKILDLLHEGVRTTLKQNEEGNNGRDGMDLALCKINKENKTIQYAGAHNPLYLLRKGKLIEYKGSRKGIGGKPLLKKKEKEFENHEIAYEEGDKIFIFSDGLLISWEEKEDVSINLRESERR
ncbi:PAS domain S-box protein [Saccharicrinis fermentans]|uniref:Putative periplasmic ligand-binding sensor domain protein n=1 Tax=Saccharicrinis fermentans DSM 9555 = JCM 21142 TaxID=869213 RepID=W7YBM5_9BACT|nr:PAS domain S-box protein [Saccharicrinis fermentans]GAF01841.1 putative periplasmic ligand-binding sensor domain protein [Saccharicrinis fermentans DSM 9555 = JCM 21142]